MNYKLTQINRPSDIILFADKCETSYPPYLNLDLNLPPTLRHGSGTKNISAVANVVFADGHTGILTKKERSDRKLYDFLK